MKNPHHFPVFALVALAGISALALFSAVPANAQVSCTCGCQNLVIDTNGNGTCYPGYGFGFGSTVSDAQSMCLSACGGNSCGNLSDVTYSCAAPPTTDCGCSCDNLAVGGCDESGCQYYHVTGYGISSETTLAAAQSSCFTSCTQSVPGVSYDGTSQNTCWPTAYQCSCACSGWMTGSCDEAGCHGYSVSGAGAGLGSTLAAAQSSCGARCALKGVPGAVNVQVDSYSCGCIPNPNACSGKSCGTVDNGCGNQVSCGTCPVNYACNASQQCIATCTADPNACSNQGRSCGTATDACGTVYPCGSCTLGASCNSGGQCVLPGGFCTIAPPSGPEGTTFYFRMSPTLFEKSPGILKDASGGWYCSWDGKRVAPTNDQHQGISWSNTDPTQCQGPVVWISQPGDGGIYNNTCVVKRTNAGP